MFSNFTQMQRDLQENYPTYKRFVSDYKPSLLLSVYSEIFSIEKSVSCIRLSLEDINVVYSTEKEHASVKYVQSWLEFLNSCSNINKPLTNTSAVGFIIYNSYKHLYLSDMKLIFEWLLRGDYGAFYNSIDAQRILTAFNQYNIQRTTINKQVQQKINNAVNAYISPFVDEIKQDICQQINEKYDSKEEKSKAFEELFNKEKIHLQEKMDEYKKEFIKSIN